jgi:hypothetical protein
VRRRYLFSYFVAVLHDERRNGEKCAKYWAVESEESEDEWEARDYLYDQWFCRELPKRISAVLNTAPDDPNGWGLKKGIFIVTLKIPIKEDDHGHVSDFKNIISIKTKDAPTDSKEVA